MLLVHAEDTTHMARLCQGLKAVVTKCCGRKVLDISHLDSQRLESPQTWLLKVLSHPQNKVLLVVSPALTALHRAIQQDNDAAESCKQCELDGDVDEELEKNLHSWTQLDVQDNVPLSPDMFPMEHRQIWVDLLIRYNTPVPSSAAVERLFSMDSDVMRPKRSSLTAKNFEKLVFLKGNMNLLKGRWELEDSDEED
ncbi:hypothetical protein GWK47_034902 [Chionoecetes opilio]|uniref:HAT C-terminal dimerisation domain-containing protein n=1 Tax=Chionoecetes opilio TaxID=41210 RepID=A0A8J4YIL1_CHIOP|nr:hypothetical protein GWK47_034902 [Chionoecetes opilio]